MTPHSTRTAAIERAREEAAIMGRTRYVMQWDRGYTIIGFDKLPDWQYYGATIVARVYPDGEVAS